MIAKSVLEKMYVHDRLSSRAVAGKLRCSEHRVNYWLEKHGIPKRTISEALYSSWNPNGDPFEVRQPTSIEEAKLYGLGIGLYWGEGTKRDKSSVRLGNSDPRLIKKFLMFLRHFYRIEEKKLRFGLQIFGDMDKKKVLSFWTRALGVSKEKFFPTIIVTPYRGVGNYRQKTQHGVVTIHFSNKKLRDIIVGAIDTESM
jgi:hypothetical protein